MTTAVHDKPELESKDYLGPARVLTVGSGEVRVKLEGGTIQTARLALAFPYEPAPDDTLLVIGRPGAHYVIGVLAGEGKTRLDLPGDVELHAGGKLRLSGTRGVELFGEEVEIVASKLRLTADSVIKKFESVVSRVAGLVSQRFGEVHTTVEQGATTKAKNATLFTEESVIVNGKQIHLG